MANSDAYRRLTLFLSSIVLIFNLGALHLYRRLPDDPLHIAQHLSIYAYFAIALAALGFMGARKGNATLVAVFSNYLLLDTVISILPRVIAILLFPTIRASICSLDTIHAWLENQTQSSAIATDQHVRAQMMGQCRRVVGVLQLLAGLLALGITIIQVMLALRVSSYARMLYREEDTVDEENQVLEAYSDDDGAQTQEKTHSEKS